MRWAGHVTRMGEGRGVYRVLVGKPEGKRPLGRPRRRWEDNIKMDLQEVGGGCEDWMELAQNRDRWRALVSTVMNLRVPKMRGISWLAAEPVSFSKRTLLHGLGKYVVLCQFQNRGCLTWNVYRCTTYASLRSLPTQDNKLWKQKHVVWDSTLNHHVLAVQALEGGRDGWHWLAITLLALILDWYEAAHVLTVISRCIANLRRHLCFTFYSFTSRSWHPYLAGPFKELPAGYGRRSLKMLNLPEELNTLTSCNLKWPFVFLSFENKS